MNIYKWINAGVVKNAPEQDFKKHGTKIENLIPCEFEKYALIYHPIQMDRNQPAISEEELSPRLQDVFTEKKKDLYLISWKDFSESRGLKFHIEISWGTFSENFKPKGRPLNILGPRDDYLYDDLRDAVLNSIQNQNGDIELYLDKDLKIKSMKISEYLNGNHRSNLFVPKDKSWIVFTPRDLCRTIIAGNADFIKQFQTEKIEMLNASPKTRLDYFADKINPTFTGR